MQKRGRARLRLSQRNKWFTFGIGIKRWLLLLGLGSVSAGIGLVYLVLYTYQLKLIPEFVYDIATLQFAPVWFRILLPSTLGAVLLLIAVNRIGTNLLAPFVHPEADVVESLYEFNMQGRGPHIVAIGGGTGMPNLLRGLSNYTRNITAIVTVADDGGSSGRLRKQLGLLPPGDFRNNIAALSRDEALMTQLLQYRFGGSVSAAGSEDLQGHPFGNLLLAALTGITGSFDEALLTAERVLAMRGRVLPSTLDNVTLVADVTIEGDAGPVVVHVVGESNIPKSGGRVETVALEPASVKAYPEALKAILRADLVVIGPGSLYTSILPNLLVPDLSDALRYTKAQKVYVSNLATQPGETDNYTVAQHVDAILKHVPADCIDLVLANDNFSVPAEVGGGKTVFVQLAPPPEIRMITADLVDEERPWRHDTGKLARAVMNLLQ